jgi:MFS family permease
LVYSFQGIGRATFEGTLKAIFADYFPYEKEGAFANIILQNGLSSSLGYLLSFSLTCSNNFNSRYCVQYRDGSFHNLFMFGIIVVMASILAVIGYWRASVLFSRGVGLDAVQRYRLSSISTYRLSHRGVSFSTVDRRTYDALSSLFENDESEPRLS